VPVALARAGQAFLLRPAPVAVDDEAHVPRQGAPGQLLAQPVLVQADSQAASRCAKNAERSPEPAVQKPGLSERHGLNLAPLSWPLLC